MEPPVLSLISSQLTGGYQLKADPAVPPTDKTSPISMVPRDVLFYIFNMLSESVKARCAMTCPRWRTALRTEEHFFRSQLMARYNVLKNLLQVNKSETGSALLARAQNFFDHPEFYHVQSLEIPSNTRVKSAVEKLFGRKKTTHDTLLIEIQNWLLQTTKLLKAQIGALNIDDFIAKHITVKSEDHYELKAYSDCLEPFLKSAFEGSIVQSMALRMNYTVPVFNAVCLAVLKYGSNKTVTLGFNNEFLLSPDQLDVFNHALPQAKNLEKIDFTANANFKFSWNAGNGLRTIKNGLVKAPKLQELHFSELPERIDEANARALADIVVKRQRLRPGHPFKTIFFGNTSITFEALKAFVEGMKSYPVPIYIYVMQAGNNINSYSQETADLYQVNNMLNLRFRHAEPLGSTVDIFYPDYNSMMGCHNDRAAEIEKKRNYPKKS